jgi:hypothetical protein
MEGQDSCGDSVDAYLDAATPGTPIGLDIKVSNEVASVSSISVPYGSFSTITLFTGLSLNANTTYYLTPAPDGSDTIDWGIDDSQPSPVL